MNASYFRQKAAQAREMAQSGDDVRLSRMLLDVASDMDAEADAIEATAATARQDLRCVSSGRMHWALIQVSNDATDQTPI